MIVSVAATGPLASFSRSCADTTCFATPVISNFGVSRCPAPSTEKTGGAGKITKGQNKPITGQHARFAVRKITFYYFSFCVITALLFVPAIARAQAGPADERLELIHFGDLVDVDVVGSFEYDWRGTLNPEGYLDGLDKIEDRISALCRTEGDIAADIARAYSRTLRDPKVVVRVLDRSNRAVAFLDGAVKFPQRFQIKRPVRLNEVIVIAGGITDNASGEIRIFRPTNLSCAVSRMPSNGIINAKSESGPETIFIKISDLLKGDPSANPSVLSGDIVTILEAAPIYVMGGVASPKQLSARARMTLSRAVSMAGGISKNGLADQIAIYRRGPGGSSVLQADLGKINADQAEDIVLQAFDIIDVGRKGFGKRQFPPVIEAGGFHSARITGLPLRIIE